jgi:hypothetical protein
MDETLLREVYGEILRTAQEAAEINKKMTAGNP